MSADLEQRTPMEVVVAAMASDGFLAKLENALPEDVSAKRFASVAITAVKQNPELITANRDSLFNSVVRCAQDGLMPDGRDAALVVYKDRDKGRIVQYMPMIGGLRKVAAEDAFTLNAHVVYENDEFDYELGARAWVKHKPAKLGEDRGKPRGAYATATDDSGRLVADPEVMSVDEIEHVRSKSKQKDGLAWKNDWPEMARKTVARRLFKSLPRGRQSSERVDRVIAAADAEFEFPPDRPRMTEGQANALASASTSDVPIGERQQLRDEPKTEGPSDAQLNRIAELLKDVDERYARATLRGVFGVEEPTELSPEEADRFEHALRTYAVDREEPAVEGEVVHEDGSPSEAGDALETPARPASEGEQASFADLQPQDVKEQQQSRSRRKETGEE